MRSSILISSTLALGLVQTPAGVQGVLERLEEATEQAPGEVKRKQLSPAASAQQSSLRTPQASANIPASGAKVETFALAPSGTGLEFYVSPRGGHLAAVTQKGSRFVVMHDGVAGPAFDEILGRDAKHRVNFSPDGARHCYLGRSGQEYVVMVDGKELARLPAPSTSWDLRLSFANALWPDFTANGKHTYFVVRINNGNETDSYRLFFDGQPMPAPWPYLKALVLSPDGDHYASIWAKRPFPGVGAWEQWGLFVDGKPAGYAALNPQFTADGKRLFTKTALPGGEGVAILLDGKPFIRALDVRLYVPPEGSGVVAVLTHKSAANVSSQFLVIGGKKVEGSEAWTIDNVYFSRDGKHYAADCQTPSRSRFMVIDGKKGQEYQRFTPIVKLKPDRGLFAFSPDSSRTAYVGHSGNKEFAVIDGVESDGYAIVSWLSFGGNGKRVGFSTFGDGLQHSIVVDGKKSERSSASVEDLTFSPDGSRYAYIYRPSGSNGSRLVVDGVDEEGASLEPMTGRKANAPVNFVFSPDGKHIVHYGEVIADRRRGFFIDGKHIPDPVGFTPYEVTFTPDGRHLFWLSRVRTPDPKVLRYVVFVDGKASASFDFNNDNTTLLTVPGVWEMGADGVLTVIAHAGGSIQRFRIRAPDDTSIDTMLASAASASSGRSR